MDGRHAIPDDVPAGAEPPLLSSADVLLVVHTGCTAAELTPTRHDGTQRGTEPAGAAR